MSNKTKGVKYMVTGAAASGKTSVLESIDDVLVIYLDKKTFPLKIPFIRVEDKSSDNERSIKYKNAKQVTDAIFNRFIEYSKKKGSYPKTVAFDSVTNLYELVANHITTTTKNNFGSWSADIGRDMKYVLNWIETSFINNGINVVLLAHTVTDANGEPKVGTSGSKTFENTGGFLGSVNYSSYIYIEEGIRLISHKSEKFATVSRNLLPKIKKLQPVSSFKINDMIADIAAAESSVNSFEV